MSATVTPPTAAPVLSPAPSPTVPTEPLLSAQLVIALYALTIAAGSIFGIFILKDISAVQAGLIGSAITGPITGVIGFYFGSSKGSQSKDATIAAQANVKPATTATP